MANIIGANIYIDGIKHNTLPVPLDGAAYDISDVKDEGDFFDVQGSYVYDDGTEGNLTPIQNFELSIWTPLNVESADIVLWYSAKGQSRRENIGLGMEVNPFVRWENESVEDRPALKGSGGLSPKLLSLGEDFAVKLSRINEHLTLPTESFLAGNSPYAVIMRVYSLHDGTNTNTLLKYGAIKAVNQRLMIKAHTDNRLNTGWYSNNLFSEEDVFLPNIWCNVSSFFDGSTREQRMNNILAGTDTGNTHNITQGGGSIGDDIDGICDFYISDLIIYRTQPNESDLDKINSFLNNQPDYRLINDSGVYEVTIGYASDVHHSSHSDRVDLNRYRLSSKEKMADAIAIWNNKNVDFTIMNGDYLDVEDLGVDAGIADIASIEAVFDTLNSKRYNSYGNHDLDVISKDEFNLYTNFENGVNNYYSFDEKGIHIIVLDACYFSEDDSSGYDAGNFSYQATWINTAQKQWLQNDLNSTTKQTLVFVHQTLDESYEYSIGNRVDIRQILESSNKVKNVFQAHTHKNDFNTINGINYHSIQALCQNPYPAFSAAIIKVKLTGDVIIDRYQSL